MSTFSLSAAHLGSMGHTACLGRKSALRSYARLSGRALQTGSHAARLAVHLSTQAAPPPAGRSRRGKDRVTVRRVVGRQPDLKLWARVLHRVQRARSISLIADPVEPRTDRPTASSCAYLGPLCQTHQHRASFGCPGWAAVVAVAPAFSQCLRLSAVRSGFTAGVDRSS
jgi:hypothetical protein